MKYYLHNSSSARLRQVYATPKADRRIELKARLDLAKQQQAKSNVGPKVNEVYDQVGNLIEWRQDTGWRDVN